MRFKALAKKFKQVVELEDPLPITVAPTERKDFVEKWIAPETNERRRLAGRMAHARERARDFMKECTRTERSLCVALACRLDSSPRPPDNYPGKFRARTA